MKTKNKIVIVAVFAAITAAFLITACKKNPDPSIPRSGTAASATLNNSGTNSKEGMRHVRQEEFKLTASGWTTLVRVFKESVQNENTQARLVDSDYLHLDSATTLLEAVLNYDFDYDGIFADTYENSSRMISRSIAIDGDQIATAEDIEGVYDSFTAGLDSMVTDSLKIKLVDLESFVYDPNTGTAIIQAYVVQAKVLLVGIWCSGSPYSGGGPLYCPSTQAYFGIFNVNYPVDAVNSLIKNLNCFERHCDDHSCFLWWSQIQSPSYYGGWDSSVPNSAGTCNYPGVLYCTPQLSSTGISNLPFLNNTDMLNYRNGILSSGLLTPPTGKDLISVQMGTKLWTNNQSAPNDLRAISWDLIPSFGIVNCTVRDQ